MNNRTLEFLREAHSLLDYPICNSDRAQLLVRLAIGEVEELLDRLALYETSDYALEQRSGGPVLVVDAQWMTPAQLVTRPRAARGQ